MLEQSKSWIELLAAGVEIAAAIVIGLAAFEAIVRALPLFLRRDMSQEAKVDIRLSLGRWLALGLEFALAADILRTAIAPSWREIGQLAAIAVVADRFEFFPGTRDCKRRNSFRRGRSVGRRRSGDGGHCYTLRCCWPQMRFAGSVPFPPRL